MSVIHILMGIFVCCVLFIFTKISKTNKAYLQKCRRQLLSREWTIRRDTITELALHIKNYGRFTPREITPLILKGVHDSDWHVRNIALATLAQHFDQIVWLGHNRFQNVLSRSEKRELIERCRRSLRDEQGSIRLEALDILTKSRDIQAFPAILKLLNDDSEQIRRAASRALKVLCPNVKAAVFTRNRTTFPTPSPQTIWNPDIASLTIPMPRLCHITLDFSNSDPCMIDQFTQYMDNVIGIPHLQERVSLKLFGDPFCCSSTSHKIWSQCKHIESDITHVAFGTEVPTQKSVKQTIKNPDVSSFPLPFSRLQAILVDTNTYNFHQVEQFLTYAINYIGRKSLKKNVEIHIYGNTLHKNLRNNFIELCKKVHIHQTAESTESFV